MRIEFMRHFKVNHKWKTSYSSDELAIECKRFDNTEIINTINIDNRYKKVYISELLRTGLTSKYLINKENIIIEPLINEDSLNPFTKINIKLPLLI